MLYPKNKEKTLQETLFQNPTSEYRGAPFWAWNNKLQKDQLLRQIDTLKEMGFGGFHMHARTGLDTEYLGDEFMNMVSACCDKAEEENMLAWLYDEDRWSSGPAGGKVTKHKPFRRKRLELFPEDQGFYTPKTEALEKGEPYLLGVYDVCLDREGYLTFYKKIDPKDTAQGDKWFAYVVNEKESTWFNGGTYLDTMDKEAVEAFVNITHERYKEVVGDRFGKSVPAIFTDEPNFHHEYTSTLPSPFYRGRVIYGWSRFFEEAYEKEYGEDITEKLPELFWICKDRTDSLTKYRYYNLCAKLFSENFFGTIGAWCRKNNLAFTGHLLREPKLYEQSQNVAETMACYGYMDIPGIDILNDAKEFTTAKQTQSAVHQYGKEAMLSELYGVTNWDFDFRGHKFQGDWQAALGVTVRVPHLAWVSMAGEAKRDFPAAIGYQSPWYKEYTQIENHFARVNTALTRGKPHVRIGVIHPIESCWLMMGPNEQCGGTVATLEKNFRDLTRALMENHLDFDFISESTLPSLQRENPCAVGEMCYDAILVPNSFSLRSSTLAFLEKFQKSGKELIFAGACPTFVDGVKNDGAKAIFAESVHTDMDIASIAQALSEVRDIEVLSTNGKAANNLIYQYRRDTDCRWLFLAHSQKPGAKRYGLPQDDVTEPEPLTIEIRGTFTPREYDTMTGEVKPVSYAIKDGKTFVKKTLYGYDSLLLCLTEKEADGFLLKEPDRQILVQKDFKTRVPYTLSEPNVLLLDRAEFSLDGKPFQEAEELLRLDNLCRERLQLPYRVGKLAQPYTMKKTPPTHTLSLRFTIESELSLENLSLALEDAKTAKVTLNGVAADTTPTGYFTDEAIDTIALPPIKKGTNVLCITLPYGARTNVEWCYLLGDFGVRLNGCEATLTARPQAIGFGDVCAQGLPFYGANITYETEIILPQDGTLDIAATKYRGSLIKVALDGKEAGSIILPPYHLEIPGVKAGKHKLSLTLFGNRHNSFGPLHNANDGELYFSPDKWRTQGDAWCYEYNLKPFGILKSPVITIKN